MCGIGEVAMTPRKDLVLIHVVDIEHDRVGGNVLVAEGARQVQHFLVRVVGVTTLLISDTPQGRHLHSAGKRAILLKYSCNVWRVHEVIVHFTLVGGKAREPVIGRAKIEKRLVGIVKEDSVSKLIVYAYVKGRRTIEWIGFDGVSEIVGVPVLITLAAAVECAGFFT